MDLCHCVVPDVRPHKNGGQYCGICNLWYVHEEWLRDSRRIRASEPANVGRNDPCPCGSGKKYKRCCL